MNTSKNEKIAILGISNDPSRYSFKAFERLLASGYKNLYGISPKAPHMDNIKIVSSLKDLDNNIHTLTVYLSKERIDALIENIVMLNPKRIILNPGTENENLEKICLKNNIKTLRACTLVLLSSDQF